MDQMDTAAPASTEHAGRIGVFDLVRGLSVISMVAFHLCYDLKFIVDLDLAWFAPPLQDVWRSSISWTFLFVAGCMCPLSRDNLRRAAQYGLVALLIWLVTTVAAVDTPISFGIIYCMAACTLVAWLLGCAGLLPSGPVAAGLLFVVFLALRGVTRGTIGLGPLTFELPSQLYVTPWLSWLGLPGPGFSSGDYYPLLPYLFLYLAGAAIGTAWAQKGYPAWAYQARIAPINFIGRHALAIYVLHQPVILGICLLAGSL